MNLQVYATSFSVEAENGISNMLLNGVDMNQVISEFSAEEVLKCIDFDRIVDFIAKTKEDDRE